MNNSKWVLIYESEQKIDFLALLTWSCKIAFVVCKLVLCKFSSVSELIEIEMSYWTIILQHILKQRRINETHVLVSRTRQNKQIELTMGYSELKSSWFAIDNHVCDGILKNCKCIVAKRQYNINFWIKIVKHGRPTVCDMNYKIVNRTAAGYYSGRGDIDANFVFCACDKNVWAWP